MALKSTIFKIELQLADLDRNRYQTHSLTLARHPSETDERMMVRLIAFALHADPALEFGKGLSADDEPDLWRKDLTGTIEQWIEIGLPDEKRLRKARGRAAEVCVVSYGGRAADLWWEQGQPALRKLDKLSVINLPGDQTKSLASHAVRTMSINCTIQEGDLLLVMGEETFHLVPEYRLRPSGSRR
ncbi:MAG: YaeQ family protein [Candidatus Nitricoxidivorans perseverans]|uniref:YaeQ family protein n=1 Tax=Candidatus Nitricoxidivorans perseverans TaxID=2975601 RepID=A0AA49IYI3_9PROT|nr:MAG: YaeQ family protein [Candidatus Nitricoxidivorans perseverans]